jgi:N-acetylneuraminate synthase
MHTETISIGGIPVGSEHPPFVIAEMSGNHNHSLQRALEIVDAAAQAGVHALKLQTYTADTITIDSNKDAFFIEDKKSLWQGQTLYELYRQAYTPWEWHETIMRRCRERGLVCFSTPFDETAVDFLETLGVPAYKIASFENNHLPLIEKAASTGKPLIISTGMASIAELDDAVRTARSAGCKDVVLLKCTSAYPSSPLDSNLLTIPHMRDLFRLPVGISDHTMGLGVSIAAVGLGACVIEKHFTLQRSDGGVDAAFSMELGEMRLLVEESRKAWQALGAVQYDPTEQEQKSSRFRRSIYVVADMKEGEIFSRENLRIIRPAGGLPPKHFKDILGRKARTAVKQGTPLTWDRVGS